MATTDRQDLNYLGILYRIGANQTPFLQTIGLTGTDMGMLTPRGRIVNSFAFPVAQPWALASASQDTQSETTASAAGTPTTTTRAQDINVCQIMKKDVSVSTAKQSAFGEFSGIQVIGNQPVTNELDWQRSVQLQQLAVDIEYSFLQGTYVATDLNPATNQTTRGMIEACASNIVAAGSVDLSKDLMDELLRTMAGNGAVFTNPVIFVNAFQKQQISNIYGYAPEDRFIGGLNIQQIETDFARIGVVYAPYMPTSTLLVADVAYIRPAFLPINDPTYQGNLVGWCDTAVVAAQRGGFYYTQIGLDHGPEEYSGIITGLTTS